jgi:DNA-binding CsgD family transcriptional regulator
LHVLDRSPANGPVAPGAVAAGVTHFLARLAADGGILAVDDWQWLDGDTRGLLELALDRPVVRRGLSVVATRLHDPSMTVADHRPVFGPGDVVRVEPLGAATMRTMLVDAFGTQLSAADRSTVLRLSSGNPLLAFELAEEHVRGNHTALPTSVLDAVRGRTERLPADVRHLLELVAVLGGVRAETLVAAGAVEPDTVDAAVRDRVLTRDGGQLVPDHPLLGSAAIELLTASDRAALHRRAAALPLDAVRRVRHLDLARPAGPDALLAAELDQAVDRAAATGASVDAHRLARRALERTDPTAPGRTGRALRAAGTAFRAGEHTDVLTVLRDVDVRSLDVPQLDEFVDLLVDAEQHLHGPAAVLERVSDLQALFPEPGPHRDVLEVARLAFSQNVRSGGAAGHPDEDDLHAVGLRIAPDVAPRALFSALHWELLDRLEHGEGVDPGLDARIRELDEATPPAAIRDDVLAAEANFVYQCDDLQRSHWLLPALIVRLEDNGQLTRLADALANATVVSVLSGELDKAAALLARAEDATHVLAREPASFHRARGLAAIARDDTAALESVLAEALPPAMGGRAAVLRSGLIGLHAAYEGSWDDALPHLRRAHATAEEGGILEPGRRLWVDVELARACAATGRRDEALGIAAALDRIATHPGRQHARGQARRVRGLAELAQDPTRAVRYLTDALVDIRAGGFVLERLRTETDLVRALLAAGRHQDARALHATALAAARRVGEPRILHDLERLAATVRDDETLSSLTAAERRVAEAAADGRTNREIAAAFHVSVRTVETHLANTYRKIGVSTRTQLALHLRGRDD